MDKNTRKTSFGKWLHAINFEKFNENVKIHGQDRYTKKLTTQAYTLLMLHAQLTEADSLHALEAALTNADSVKTTSWIQRFCRIFSSSWSARLPRKSERRKRACC